MSTGHSDDAPRTDVAVIGAGFAGLYAIYRLVRAGFAVRAFEAGEDVGGTWYWNRYPGARVDIPNVAYSYSFSDELDQTWDWSERYCTQPEIERYARHVAERFDLRRHITFGKRVVRATFLDESGRWSLLFQDGSRVNAKYVVSCVGGYSDPVVPDIDGLDLFEGETLLTARWPVSSPDFTGKRVAVLGTGASGQQVATALAATPVKSLHVLQRTANFAVPAQNHLPAPDDLPTVRPHYPAYRERARWSNSGTNVEGPVGAVADLTDEQFTARMDDALAAGGVHVTLGVTDLMSSRTANERVAEYLRDLVRSRVHDPVTAEALCPSGYPVGTRRILVESGYFEIFNLPHVSLVDLRRSPIMGFDAGGLKLKDGYLPLDAIVFATGFDSGTGSVLRMNVTGRHGTRLDDAWRLGPRTFLGLMVEDFPNFFTVTGPGSPSIRSNVMVSIEAHVDWVTALLRDSEDRQVETVEPTPLSCATWTDYTAATAEQSLLGENRETQYWGANVPGKPRVYLAFVGGVGLYRSILDEIAERGYQGLRRRGPHTTTTDDWTGPSPEVAEQSWFGASIV